MPDPITSPAIERYIEQISPARPPLLARVEAHAREHRLPIVGPIEGRFLFTLVRLARPQRLLELGACSGYSALWFAAATAPFGTTIETIELDPQRADITEQHFGQSEHAGRITLLRGNALDILPTLERDAYDLIFNDLLRSGAGETGGVPNQVRFLRRPGGRACAGRHCGGDCRVQPAADDPPRSRNEHRPYPRWGGHQPETLESSSASSAPPLPEWRGLG